MITKQQQKKKLVILEKKLEFINKFGVNNLPWGYTVGQYEQEVRDIKKAISEIK